MPLIDADTTRKLITAAGELFVPESITKAISQAVQSDATVVSNGITKLADLYNQYITRDEPTPVDYEDASIIDAYAIHYLPRVTLIPKLFFLSLSYHPAFQNIKDEINILDLGGGTGGTVLGLLDLFKGKPYSEVKLNIMCCERSKLALNIKVVVDKGNLKLEGILPIASSPCA